MIQLSFSSCRVALGRSFGFTISALVAWLIASHIHNAVSVVPYAWACLAGFGAVIHLLLAVAYALDVASNRQLIRRAQKR